MQTRNQRIYKVTLMGSIVNMVLLVLKFIAGILGHSAAMVADAVHSLSDFLTDIVVIAFVKLSSKPADHDHATSIEQALRAEFGNGTHIMLHIEPVK